ncbi:ribonuclease D, partial [Actinotignum timonense]|nr:ribonuclease D [Actinotignum timonense]
AWALPSSELPEPAPARPARRAERGIPHLLDHVRGAVQERAAELGIRHDVLLKPAVQRELARLLRHRVARTAPAIGDALAELGARPWQVENTATWIAAAVR